jgi:phosphinothricin acetyltransferase
VAVDATAIAGFAKASPWKGRCAYAHSAETTVYLAADARGRGVGRALYEKLFAMLRAQGFRTLLAGITLPNEPSVRLHESMGMKRIALLERVGWKFDRWHDVGYWQVHLGESDEAPSPIRTVLEVAAQCDL